ncbi:unnamed protein product, partial [Heterosigma akashiwo]
MDMAFLLLPTLHNWFLRHIKTGNEVVNRLQKFRCGPLDHLLLGLTMMGHENSYLAMIPFIAWNVDPSLGRQLLTLW